MAIPNRTEPPELVDLPTEVLLEIFKHVPDEDLLSARLVCKQLCDAATPRFAKVNFTERFHVVSPYSINALVDITEHPVFSKYVEVVAISSARRIVGPHGFRISRLCMVEEASPTTYDNAYVKTGRFARRMERVFGNLRSHSGFVAISIHDRPGRSYLYTEPYLVSDRSKPNRFYGSTDLLKSRDNSIAYRTVETLEQCVYAARRARCSVKRIKLHLCAFRTDNVRAELDAAMHKILVSSLSPLSVCLCTEPSYLSYDNELQRLELRDVGLEAYSDRALDLPLNATYSWLSTKAVTQLKITLMDSYELECFQPFLTPRLKRLEIRTMSVWTDHFNQDLWSEHIQTISGLSNLEYCKLDNLSYTLAVSEYNDDHSDLSYLDIPGYGRYPLEVFGFYLTFRNGKDEIEMSGDNVCERLKDLACYVAAAEAQKVQQIVSDGCVKNEMIGIIDEAEDQSKNGEIVLS
ncbi:hypothetical protein KCU71_g3363, partial [Aureobasidium melanogenum]